MSDPMLRDEFTGEVSSDERRLEAALRPRTLDEFVGQDALRANLRVFISAARGRGEPVDHHLFCGPPGLGKTALAYVLAREMGATLRATSGPVLERPSDLAALLSNLDAGDVLFVDEIHRLHPAVEEILYPAMEDFHLDVVIGQGPSARSIRLDLPRFTLVGATTRAGLLSAPLRDRFGYVARLDYYPPADLVEILRRSSQRLGVEVDADAAGEIARRSRGTPASLCACCAACAISRRWKGRRPASSRRSPTRLRAMRSAGSRSTKRASIASTARSCAPCSTSSTADPWASTLSRRRSARIAAPSRTSWSRSCCRPVSSTAPRAAASRRRGPGALRQGAVADGRAAPALLIAPDRPALRRRQLPRIAAQHASRAGPIRLGLDSHVRRRPGLGAHARETRRFACSAKDCSSSWPWR